MKVRHGQSAAASHWRRKPASSKVGRGPERAALGCGGAQVPAKSKILSVPMKPKIALMVRLSQLLFWFDESLQASLRKAGFEPASRTQSMFLMCLAGGSNKPSQIAVQLGVTRQVVSHIVNQLTERGLITSTTDPEDARSRIIEYSTGAQDLRDAAHEIVRALEALLKKRIGAKAFQNLGESLAYDWGDLAVIDLEHKRRR